MAEAQITRSAIIVVDTVSNNTYGDLVFTDKGGGNYKVGNKRVKYFEDKIISGMSVQLNFSQAYGKEYIYNASLVDGNLPPPVTPPLPEQGNPSNEEVGQPRQVNPQAVGMITKEIGDMIRSQKLSEIYGRETASRLISWYRQQTLNITGVQWSNLPNFE